jgi:ATP synthase protein I
MTEGDPPLQSKDFAARLRALRERVRPADDGEGPGRGAPQTPAGWVFRLSVELVVGLVVGGGIGWLLDRWLGTSPLLLILFFLVGAAAGMYNVVRAAREINRG